MLRCAKLRARNLHDDLNWSFSRTILQIKIKCYCLFFVFVIVDFFLLFFFLLFNSQTKICCTTIMFTIFRQAKSGHTKIDMYWENILLCDSPGVICAMTYYIKQDLVVLPFQKDYLNIVNFAFFLLPNSLIFVNKGSID